MKKIWIISNNYVLEDIFPEENGAIAYMMRAYGIKKDDLTVENDSTFVSGTSSDGEFIMASQWEIGDEYQKFVIVSQIWKDGDNLKTSMFVNGFSQYSDLQMIKHLLGIEKVRLKRTGPVPFCDSIYHCDGKEHSVEWAIVSLPPAANV